MKVTKKITINVPIEKAWEEFATKFDDAHVWMSSVYKSYSRPSGGGRVCELSTKPDGVTADETVNELDNERHLINFTVVPQNAPGLLPVNYNVVTVTMKKIDENTTEVIWVAEPNLKTAGKVLSPLLKAGLGKLFGNVLEEFKFYVENGKPHPKKTKVMSKVA